MLSRYWVPFLFSSKEIELYHNTSIYEISDIVITSETYILASWVSDSLTTDVLFFNSLITLQYLNPYSCKHRPYLKYCQYCIKITCH